MRRTAVFLSAGLVGVVALLSGLALDSYLHSGDPNLAHREGLFTLSNPGHVLLGIGIGLVVVGVVGAAYTTLPFGVWMRRGMLAGALALIVVSGDVAGWAASVQFSSSSSSANGHDHTAGAPARQPTAAELAAAAQLVADTKAAVARYVDLKVAIAAREHQQDDASDAARLADRQPRRTVRVGHGASGPRHDRRRQLVLADSDSGPVVVVERVAACAPDIWMDEVLLRSVQQPAED